MSWGEAIRLTTILSTDPSSAVAASIARWDAPRSREWMVLADIFDLTHLAHSQQRSAPSPYPRPQTRVAPKIIPRQDVITVLNSHGHSF